MKRQPPKTRLDFIVKSLEVGLVFLCTKPTPMVLSTRREMQVLGQYLIQAEPFTDTLKKFKISSFSTESIAHFLAQDGEPRRSQRHFVALDADFDRVCRSAFFPDVCELPHLLIQPTDALLGGPLKPGRLHFHIPLGPDNIVLV